MNYEEAITQFASDELKRLVGLLKENPITDEDFFQNFYNSKNELDFQINSYFERNNLDVMMYPTMPILP